MPDPVSRLQLVQLVDKDVTIEVGRDAVQESLMLSVIAVAPPCQSCVQNHRGRSSCRCCWWWQCRYARRAVPERRGAVRAARSGAGLAAAGVAEGGLPRGPRRSRASR